MTQNTFKEIKDPKHPIRYSLLPVKVPYSQMVLHPVYSYLLPNGKAIHYGWDFIPCCVRRSVRIVSD